MWVMFALVTTVQLAEVRRSVDHPAQRWPLSCTAAHCPINTCEYEMGLLAVQTRFTETADLAKVTETADLVTVQVMTSTTRGRHLVSRSRPTKAIELVIYLVKGTAKRLNRCATPDPWRAVATRHFYETFLCLHVTSRRRSCVYTSLLRDVLVFTGD